MKNLLSALALLFVSSTAFAGGQMVIRKETVCQQERHLQEYIFMEGFILDMIALLVIQLC